MAEERGRGTGFLVGGVGGTVLGTVIGLLIASKPAEAATPEEKLAYLIELMTALIPVLADVATNQTTLIQLLQQWLAAQGIEPGAEVSVLTPWVAQEPVEIFYQEVRSIGTFNCDRMADYRRGKRILIKVESSLDQIVQIQVVGNIEDSMALATNMNGVFNVAANGNISIGVAWDDWHPFLGVRVIAAVAPLTGRLKVAYSIQE